MERYIGSGQTLYSLFYPASVSDPNPLTDTETVNVALNETGDASLTKGNPGSISDPLNPNLTSATFSESGLIAGTPPFAQNLLDRLYYNAPALSNGQSDQVSANVTMSVAASPGEPSPSAPSLSPSSVTIDVVTPPLISGTVANQPVAAGGTIKPFSTVGVTDNDFNQTAKDTATITVSDGLYTSPTDKDGLLTGSGLSQLSPGSYSIPNAVAPATLTSELQNLTFAASSNFYGVRTANMTLTVTDHPPSGTTPGGYYWNSLTSWDYTTSVRETGQPISITGLATTQNVVEGDTIDPFASAIINDDSTNAAVSVTISEDIPANGSLSGSGTNGSSVTLSGYVGDVTKALDNLVFTPTTPNLPATTKFTLTLTDAGIGETGTATTSVTETLPPSEPMPLVVGTAQEGQTLTASDSDASATFRWQRLVSGTWTPINGATGSTYTVAEADENNVLRVVATGSNGQTAASAATAKVIDVTPTLSVAVSGTAQEAQVLTATPTLGTDSDDSGNSVNYQWQRSSDGNNWTNISGATANTYTATESDENNLLRVVASFTDDTMQTVAAVSSATAKVIDVTPSLTVSLSGVPKDGDALTAIPAVITDEDNSASDVTYQWQRSTDDSSWNNIGGATGGSYTLTAADVVGDFVRTVASFTDDTGQTAMANSTGTQIVAGEQINQISHIAVFDTTTGQSVPATGQLYTGPVSGLQSDYISVTSDSLNISVSSPNWFIHSGGGNDAIAASSGINVLDGGTGSNFLTGGSGTDTFFVDDRSASADIWSTVVGFHAGDAATIWGVTPQDFSLTWVDGQGAAGYTGLTLHATSAGKPIASLTLAGFSQADMTSGRLSVSFGTVGGSAYMYVHGNS